MEKAEARRLLERAREAFGAEEWRRCAETYEQVLAHFPDEKAGGAWWYDAALAYKFLRDWPKAYALGREAAARAPRGEGDPAFWNLGIAATILREWGVARDAWEGFGVPVPEGEGPIDVDGAFGMACVRLETDGGQEVVWARRLCPTRAQVVSVPFTGGRRFGEVVVHDGEPKGERVVDGQRIAVFDELVLFEPSPLPTLVVTVHAAEAADVHALVGLFAEEGFGAEPKSGFVLHCRCCSEGTVEYGGDSVHAGEQEIALAAPPEEAGRILDVWSGQVAGGRGWSALQPVS